MELDRRELLAGAGTGVAGLLAGCSGNNDGMSSEDVNRTLEKDTETESSTERPTETATPEPLMEGEEAYDDARLTDGDVQSIRFDKFDHNIPGVERLVESSYEEENLEARLQRARTRQDALQQIFEFASRTIKYSGADVSDDDADAIAVARELIHHADEYSDFSFDYEDTMIDEHTIYAGEVGQDASVLFKDEDGEWNHHYADPFKNEWRGPATETDYFSEDPGFTASTQSPRGFWGYMQSLGSFDDQASEIDWQGFSRDTNNFMFGRHDYNTNSNVQIYFDGDTYHSAIPEMHGGDASGIAEMVRYVNEVASKTQSDGLKFSYEGGNWNHQEVDPNPSHFRDMMEARTT